MHFAIQRIGRCAIVAALATHIGEAELTLESSAVPGVQPFPALVHRYH